MLSQPEGDVRARLTLRQVEEAISTNIIASLKEALLSVFGPSVSAIILFRLGELLGVKEAKRLLQAMEGPVQSLLAKVFNNTCYGRMSLAIFNPRELEGKVCVKNLIDRDGLITVNGDGGGVGCYFYKGFIKGAASILLRSNVTVHEVRCSLKGAPHCEYYFAGR